MKGNYWPYIPLTATSAAFLIKDAVGGSQRPCKMRGLSFGVHEALDPGPDTLIPKTQSNPKTQIRQEDVGMLEIDRKPAEHGRPGIRVGITT